VDVIIPVWNAPAELEVCLRSLQAWTDLSRHRLIAVLDGPGQDQARQALDRLVDAGASVLVLENRENRGYVVSVNRGMAASHRDVVLLNSDTAVTRDWLERLSSAAYVSPSVATATPFSNNATLCSIPRPLVENDLPKGHDVDSFARLVEACSRRTYPRIPHGVGFCLFIKRAALQALGDFDEVTFGLGYGEEVDFCLRALKAGYVHVLDDATFVYHAGGRSFGGRKAALVQAALQAIFLRYPEYRATFAAFLRANPVGPARQRVLDAMARPR
jgi:GT2 family glycosyltransferase